MPEVTITFFNHRTQAAESRRHQVADLERATIERVVDLFDAQVGTVLSVYADSRCLHRSAVDLDDLLP